MFINEISECVFTYILFGVSLYRPLIFFIASASKDVLLNILYYYFKFHLPFWQYINPTQKQKLHPGDNYICHLKNVLNNPMILLNSSGVIMQVLVFTRVNYLR